MTYFILKVENYTLNIYEYTAYLTIHYTLHTKQNTLNKSYLTIHTTQFKLNNTHYTQFILKSTHYTTQVLKCRVQGFLKRTYTKKNYLYIYLPVSKSHKQYMYYGSSS